MTTNSWYDAVAADAPLTQGDLLDDFPLVGWKSGAIQVEQDKNLGESLRGATEIVQANVVVMTPDTGEVRRRMIVYSIRPKKADNNEESSPT